MSVKFLKEYSSMEQYQYVDGFQRFHTGLRLRCAACLSLQFLLFEYLHYDIYSTGHRHCSTTRVFHAWKSAILHANSTRKTCVKHSCKKIHAKIDEKIHANKENLRAKLYTQVFIICVYSVYLSFYIAG